MRGGTAGGERPGDRSRWTDLCLNAAGEVLGAACAAPNGELARNPALREILIACTREAAAAAASDGHRLLVPRPEQAAVKACLAHPGRRSSVLRDLRARRRTQLAAIVGPILAAARRTGTPAPLLTRLYRVVRRLERLP